MKRNGLFFLIFAVFFFSFLPAFAENSETLLRPGEWKCDWSVPSNFSGSVWITVKEVKNGVIKGEVLVTGSSAIGYEKFATGKLESNILTIPLQRFLLLLTIKNGKIVGGESRDLLNPRFNANIDPCFKIK